MKFKPFVQCFVLLTQLMSAHPEKPFIKNKAAQVFALTFVMEYLTLWPKFFFDVLSLVGLNPHGLDIYLRTLMAIDAEVVDRDILHTPEVCHAVDLCVCARVLMNLHLVTPIKGEAHTQRAEITSKQPKIIFYLQPESGAGLRKRTSIFSTWLCKKKKPQGSELYDARVVLITERVFLQETRRNTLIKDRMRETCIPALVESWYQILQTYQRSHSELTCQCLEVVGAYVSWIDLNLIANDRYREPFTESL